MQFRRGSQVALQASLLLALQPQGSVRRVRDLAEEVGVGATYLVKILQNLSRVGLLRGARGPGGGVQLARPAKEISPWEILAAVEPEGELEQCVLGLDPCDSFTPCPLHDAWKPIRSQILAMLRDRSLQDIAVDAHEKGILRSDMTPEKDGKAGQSESGERI